MTDILTRLLNSSTDRSAHELYRLCIDAAKELRYFKELLAELAELLAEAQEELRLCQQDAIKLQLAAENNMTLLARVREFDKCIKRIATELGGVCCGGVDGDQNDPGSTTAVLVEAIEQEKRKARYEAIGWCHAFCCFELDNGGDPRQVDCAAMLEQAKIDLGRNQAKLTLPPEAVTVERRGVVGSRLNQRRLR